MTPETASRSCLVVVAANTRITASSATHAPETYPSTSSDTEPGGSNSRVLVASTARCAEAAASGASPSPAHIQDRRSRCSFSSSATRSAAADASSVATARTRGGAGSRPLRCPGATRPAVRRRARRVAHPLRRGVAKSLLHGRIPGWRLRVALPDTPPCAGSPAELARNGDLALIKSDAEPVGEASAKGIPRRRVERAAECRRVVEPAQDVPIEIRREQAVEERCPKRRALPRSSTSCRCQLHPGAQHRLLRRLVIRRPRSRDRRASTAGTPRSSSPGLDLGEDRPAVLEFGDRLELGLAASSTARMSELGVPGQVDDRHPAPRPRPSSAMAPSTTHRIQ